MTSLRALTLRARGSDFVRHGLLVFAGLLAANVLQFAFYFLLSRVVGVERYGVLTSLFSAALLIATGPATVAGTVVARLAADLRAVSDMEKLRRLSDLINRFTALLGIAGFAIVAAFALAVANYLHLASVQPVLLTGIILGFSLAIPVQRGVLQGSERFGPFALSTIIEAGSKVLICPILAIRFGVDGALVGFSIACFLTWWYNVVELRRTASRSARLQLDLRRIVKTWTNVSLAVLAINALLFYDVILVRHYFSALTAGLYGAAALAARALYMLISFIPTVVLPKATARQNTGRKTGSLLIASIGTASVFVGAALLAAWLAPRFMVSVLAGRAYADAGQYVFAYMFALGALALANVVTMYNIGLHRFDFVAPLAAIAVGEILAVFFWHTTVHTTLSILCIGHSLALASTLIRFPFREARPQRHGAAPTAV